MVEYKVHGRLIEELKRRQDLAEMRLGLSEDVEDVLILWKCEQCNVNGLYKDSVVHQLVGRKGALQMSGEEPGR